MSKKVSIDKPPKELALFSRFKRPDCIPLDAAWEDLTPEQQQLCRDAYRFSGYTPGIYQCITGIQGM